MVEEDEDDFIEARPHRTCASQVWRLWRLFEQFLDNLALVWLFCRDFLPSLDIFCRFLDIFSRYYGDFQSFLFGDFQSFFWIFSVRFMEIFSRFFGDFQSFYGDFQSFY